MALTGQAPDAHCSEPHLILLDAFPTTRSTSKSEAAQPDLEPLLLSALRANTGLESPAWPTLMLPTLFIAREDTPGLGRHARCRVQDPPASPAPAASIGMGFSAKLNLDLRLCVRVDTDGTDINVLDD